MKTKRYFAWATFVTLLIMTTAIALSSRVTTTPIDALALEPTLAVTPACVETADGAPCSPTAGCENWVQGDPYGCIGVLNTINSMLPDNGPCSHYLIWVQWAQTNFPQCVNLNNCLSIGYEACCGGPPPPPPLSYDRDTLESLLAEAKEKNATIFIEKLEEQIQELE